MTYITAQFTVILTHISAARRRRNEKYNAAITQRATAIINVTSREVKA